MAVMTIEQDEHVEDQTQASHTFTYWMSPQYCSYRQAAGSTYLHHRQINTSHLNLHSEAPMGGWDQCSYHWRKHLCNYHAYAVG